MICPKCGSEMNDGSAFCTKCGAALNAQNNEQAKGNSNPQADPQMNGMPPVSYTHLDVYKRQIIRSTDCEKY